MKRDESRNVLFAIVILIAALGIVPAVIGLATTPVREPDRGASLWIRSILRAGDRTPALSFFAVPKPERV